MILLLWGLAILGAIGVAVTIILQRRSQKGKSPQSKAAKPKVVDPLEELERGSLLVETESEAIQEMPEVSEVAPQNNGNGHINIPGVSFVKPNPEDALAMAIQEGFDNLSRSIADMKDEIVKMKSEPASTDATTNGARKRTTKE